MRLIPYILVALVLVGGMVYLGSIEKTTVYEKTIEPTETEDITTSDYPPEWLEEAEEAKERVLRVKTLEAERSTLEDEIETINARISEIETELSF